jgi:outer membrane protein assembly factor BamB
VAGDGELICCDKQGQELWRLNMVKDLNGEVNPIGGGPQTYGWGYCWSPVVDGERLICVPGGPKGMVAALNKANGDVLWRSEQLTEMATYSSPLLATIHGVRQIVLMTQQGVAGVAADDGQLLWHYTRSQPYSDVVIPTPVVDGNRVYISCVDGCELIELTVSDGRFQATSLYASRESRNMKNILGGFVLLDGFIYGCSDRRGWVCQELSSGELKWYKRGAGGIGDGSIIYADGHLYLFSEREGEVALVEASPEKWLLKSKFTLPKFSEQRAPSGRAWTHPVIADGRLYLRDQELFYCYQIK